ncbi:MAG: cell division protein FtsZ [Candidatus Pacebacteria bacterium]|nr:cell division protein FtsZ [Candidatus Paceibacterota bacterium]
MFNPINIKVVGVGGSGCNAIGRMEKDRIRGVELIALNSDYQDLKKIKADVRIQIGRKLTQGLGTGMNPEIGRKAAEEQRDEIKKAIEGAGMVFVACGLGGGTGSGAAPVVAEIAKSSGALTVAVVTRPFSFEGAWRARIAQEAMDSIKGKVDSLISISNDKMLSTLNPNTTLANAFWICDEILRQAVQSISDLVLSPGIINVDFADVRSILKDSGRAIFGIGRAKGEKRAEVAARAAIESPLFDVNARGAKGVLFNISGGSDISLSEIEEAAKIVTSEINSRAKVIFGAVHDNNLPKGEIKIMVVATGF